MGQSHYNYNNNYDLEIDKKLKKMISKELEDINSKNEIKKFKKLVNKKTGHNFKRSKFIKKFNENGNGVKNITDILNLIYDQNIDREQKLKSNRTIHEILFDVRDAVELINVNDEKYLEKKNDYDKFKRKISKTMELLISPKEQNINYINYDIDINDNQNNINSNNVNIYENNNQNNNNNNLNFNEIQTYDFSNNIVEIKPLFYNNPIKQDEAFDKNNNYENHQNNNNIINNNYLINNVDYQNINIKNDKKPASNYDINNNCNNNKFHIKNVEFKNIRKTNNIKNNNYNYNKNKIPNDKHAYNNNNNLQLPKNKNNNNNNINTFIYKNSNKKIAINYNNKANSKQIHKNNNIKSSNVIKNRNDNTNKNVNKSNKHYINNKNSKEEPNLIMGNSNSVIEEKTNQKNDLIYNKKNIKKIRAHSYDLQKNNNFNEYNMNEGHKINKNTHLKKESEIILNYNNKRLNSKNEQICKNEEIFIEKSPKKKINRDYKINKKYFTVRNEINNINDNSTGYKDIYLKTEIYKNNSKNNNKNIEKPKSNIKKKKHSKKPKKDPVVNIQIDLKDLIKQEKMEKLLDNNININRTDEKPKKTIQYFDYPEDLKYNVFGKQYKFTYND